MTSKTITQALSAANGVYFENAAELDALLVSLRDMYRPANPAEDFLVEQMAGAQWDIRRYRRVLTGLLDYQTAIAAERLETERRQDRARTDPEIHHANTLLLGAAFHLDCREDRAQLTLHRMLMDLDRAYYRALNALEAAQARRAKADAIEAQASKFAAAEPRHARHTVAIFHRAPAPGPEIPMPPNIPSPSGNSNPQDPPNIQHSGG